MLQPVVVPETLIMPCLWLVTIHQGANPIGSLKTLGLPFGEIQVGNIQSFKGGIHKWHHALDGAFVTSYTSVANNL